MFTVDIKILKNRYFAPIGHFGLVRILVCVQGDSRSPAWLQSTTPFLPGLASSSLTTCVRRQEVWLGGANTVSRDNTVHCQDNTFVHCRTTTDRGEAVNICQSVLSQCNGQCFKGRDWCEHTKTCVLHEAFHLLCPSKPAGA